ncbi:GAF domain-containing protein [Shouchella miscanthi]|uniref:GAF domain-containing protein n=1 Tax=Shouchella miscanthi TaxID=2598861 RepID=UPI001643A06E|nr:GAF domain-containing protein [Shouchella miscanthi]
MQKANTHYQSHDSLIEVSNKLFKCLAQQLDVNTAYIAKKEPGYMDVVNAYNRDREIVTNDMSVEYKESNCKYVLENEAGIQYFTNLMTNANTAERPITEKLQVKAFLGVSIYGSSGEPFGTLCVMDEEERQFSNEDVTYIRTIADVLSFIIELDETHEDIDLLSVPIIPISADIAILALQGKVSQSRAVKIMDDTMGYAVAEQIKTIIIDISEIVVKGDEFIEHLNRLVAALNLMGVSVMLSGVPIHLAANESISQALSTLDLQYVKSIEDALGLLGYELTEQ